jgi:hypothetical protein
VHVPIGSALELHVLLNGFASAPCMQVPDVFPFAVIVSVASESDPLATAGKWHCISPVEMLHAFIMAVHRDVRNGSSDTHLVRWRNIMLCTRVGFEVIDSPEDEYFRATNLREIITTEFHTLARTAFKRVCEIASFKARIEKAPISAQPVVWLSPACGVAQPTPLVWISPFCGVAQPSPAQSSPAQQPLQHCSLSAHNGSSWCVQIVSKCLGKLKVW